MCSLICSRIVYAIIESLPSIFVIISGFFIFHALASRRQKRDEIHKSIEYCRSSINDLLSVSEVVWSKNGKEAISSGGVLRVKSIFVNLSVEIDSLCGYSDEFNICKEPYRDLKMGIDELTVTENGKEKIVNLMDENRRAISRLPVAPRQAAMRLNKALRTAFTKRYG